MPVLIQLPQVGESVTEGTIDKWLVQAGAHIRKYDPIVEITTDKVSMEVPSPFDGVVLRLLAKEGDTVQMGHPIAEIEIEKVNAPPGTPETTGVVSLNREAERRARIGEFLEGVRSVGPTGSGEGGAGRPDAALEDTIETSAPTGIYEEEASEAEDEAPSDSNAALLSPAVRRLVAEHGVDITQVAGTGQGGRVTRDDVLALLETQEKSTDPSVEESRGNEAPDQAASVNVAPLSPIRRSIAHHMERALEIPAAWSMVEVDVSGLVACRDVHKADFEAAHGAPLTYLAFAAEALAQALREHPRLNASWTGNRIEYLPNINLNIAVSTNKGLVVPVIHDADRLSVGELAVAIHQIVEKARADQLTLADVQGGTFTLNNTGALGSVLSVPIINHPQAAIMTTEAVVKRPVVIEHDTISARSMMNVCMSFDHRVCDGADAGTLLDEVKTRLQLITTAQRI